MARSAGLSGVAVGMVAAGAFLVDSGLRDTSLPDALRSLLTGQVPVSRSGAGATTSGAPAPTGTLDQLDTAGGGDARIAEAAMRYVGAPYRGGAAGPDRFDCSGLVTWVMHHDLGYQLPSNRHTTSAQFAVWSGARTIPRNQAAAGDLLCWVGHVAIALDSKRMVTAPGAGQWVKVSNIWGTPAVRRVIVRNSQPAGTGRTGTNPATRRAS